MLGVNMLGVGSAELVWAVYVWGGEGGTGCGLEGEELWGHIAMEERLRHSEFRSHLVAPRLSGPHNCRPDKCSGRRRRGRKKSISARN